MNTANSPDSLYKQRRAIAGVQKKPLPFSFTKMMVANRGLSRTKLKAKALSEQHSDKRLSPQHITSMNSPLTHPSVSMQAHTGLGSGLIQVYTSVIPLQQRIGGTQMGEFTQAELAGMQQTASVGYHWDQCGTLHSFWSFVPRPQQQLMLLQPR